MALWRILLKESHMTKPIIAVFNSSDDTVEMLRTALEGDGLHTVSGHIGELKKGELDFVAFIEHHRPASSSTTSRCPTTRTGTS